MAATVEERLASLEASYASIADRLSSIDQRLNGLDQRLTTEIGQLRSALDQRFLWMLGVMLSGFATIVGLIATRL